MSGRSRRGRHRHRPQNHTRKRQREDESGSSSDSDGTPQPRRAAKRARQEEAPLKPSKKKKAHGIGSDPFHIRKTQLATKEDPTLANFKVLTCFTDSCYDVLTFTLDGCGGTHSCSDWLVQSRCITYFAYSRRNRSCGEKVKHWFLHCFSSKQHLGLKRVVIHTRR